MTVTRRVLYSRTSNVRIGRCGLDRPSIRQTSRDHQNIAYKRFPAR
jgi:Tat protein secretion system quality control protein TatD with DNase activity